MKNVRFTEEQLVAIPREAVRSTSAGVPHATARVGGQERETQTHGRRARDGDRDAKGARLSAPGGLCDGTAARVSALAQCCAEYEGGMTTA